MCRLVFHCDHIGRVANLTPTRQVAALGDQWLKHVFLTVQDKADVRILVGRTGNAGNNSCRPLIATHGVYGDNDAPARCGRLIHWCSHADARPLGLSGCVVVQIDFVGHRDDFTVGIVATG
jgi:hypothetical protein